MRSRSISLRTKLAAVFLFQAMFMVFILFDQTTMGGFSGPFGIVEVCFIGIAWLVSSAVSDTQPSPRISLKKILVFWAIVSLIVASLCIFEGAALDYGPLRAFWSFVYIIPACLSMYQAGKLRKW